MIKKTLGQKIKQASFWMFSGFFLYLVVAFFLKSDYPFYEYPFNHKDAYEVIKDALTIIATISAPLAAYVLYSDWKEPYYETIKDSVMTEIFNLIFYIQKGLFDLKLELSSTCISDFKNRDNDIFDKLIKLEHNLKRLERLGFSQSEYVINTNITLKNLKNLKNNISSLNFYQMKLRNILTFSPNLSQDIAQCQKNIDDVISESNVRFQTLGQDYIKINEWKMEKPE